MNTALPIIWVAPAQAKPESETSSATAMVGKAVVRITVSIDTRATEMQMATMIAIACIFPWGEDKGGASPFGKTVMDLACGGASGSRCAVFVPRSFMIDMAFSQSFCPLLSALGISRSVILIRFCYSKPILPVRKGSLKKKTGQNRTGTRRRPQAFLATESLREPSMRKACAVTWIPNYSRMPSGPRRAEHYLLVCKI